MSFKVIIAGGRNFDCFTTLSKKCDQILRNKTDIEIVSGKAPGADTLGELYAENRKLPIKEFPAPWNDIEGKPSREIGTRRDGSKYWKGAGHFRNGQMAQYADALIAFWDGRSPGTSNMINQAVKFSLPIRIIYY